MTAQTTRFMSEHVRCTSPAAVCCLEAQANMFESRDILHRFMWKWVTKPYFFCPAQQSNSINLRLKSVAGWKSPFLKATQPRLPQCDMFPQQQDWVTKSAFFFFIFSHFNILPTDEGSTIAVVKTHLLDRTSIQRLEQDKKKKKNQRKEFAPAGFLRNTSEFFAANETRNIWRSFPMRRGLKILHFVTNHKSIGHLPVIFIILCFLNFRLEKWQCKTFSSIGCNRRAVVLSGHFHVRVWFSSNL